jgi:hypothetical protein
LRGAKIVCRGGGGLRREWIVRQLVMFVERRRHGAEFFRCLWRERNDFAAEHGDGRGAERIARLIENGVRKKRAAGKRRRGATQRDGAPAKSEQ